MVQNYTAEYVTQLSEIDTISDDDIMFVSDSSESDAAHEPKKAPASKVKAYLESGAASGAGAYVAVGAMKKGDGPVLRRVKRYCWIAEGQCW